MTDPNTTAADATESDQPVADQPTADVVDQVVGVGVRKGFALPRDTEVTIVPAGHRIMLAKGDRVTLLQALGGTATVTVAPPSDAPFSVDLVWEAATTVYDPEIPVDIVELGLVYRVDAEQVSGGGWRVEVDMSVTAPFCGMGDILRQDLHDAVAALNGVDEVEVKLVFDPPWNASRLSEVARLELGMM